MSFIIAFIFFGKSQRNDWFSLGVLSYLLSTLIIIFTIAFFLLFLNKKKLKIDKLIKPLGLSILTIISTFIFSFFYTQNEQREWKEKNNFSITENEREEKLNYKIDSLNKILQYNPDKFDLIIQRGLLKRELGNIEASIIDYKKALEIEPNSFRANLELGFSLKIIGKEKEADIYFRNAVKIDTNSYFSKRNPKYRNSNKTSGNIGYRK